MGIKKNIFSKAGILKALYALPAIIIVLLTFNRLFYGAELTDEAYYLAIPKAFLNGMIPFATNWDIPQTSAFFLVPFIYIFRLVTGGFEGVFLYSRIIYFTFTLFVAAVGYFGISKYISKPVSLYASLILVTYAPFSIYNASYNNLAFSFLLLGLFLLINAFSIDAGDIAGDIADKQQKRKKALIFLAGVSHAFLAFFYPVMAILSVLIGLFVVPRVIYKSSGYKGIFRLWKFYICGGAITGVALFGILLIAAGGVGNFLSGLQGILSNPVYSEDTGLGLSMISGILDNILGALRRQRLHILIYPFILLMFFLYKARRKIPKVYALLAFAPLVALFYVWYVPVERDTLLQIDFSFITGGVLPVGLFFLIKEPGLTAGLKEKFAKLFALLYLPALFGFLIVSDSSAGSYLQAPWIMVGGMILSAVFTALLLYESLGKRAASVLGTLMCIFFCISNVFMHYSEVYRDAPVRELGYRVEHGIYKGIRTTEPRKRLLENTERLIKSIDQEGKKLMAMDKVPFAYLLSDMQPSGPNLWSATYYGLGQRDCAQLFAYYSKEDRIPDFVFFFYPSESMYGNDPDYELHTWLRENYVITQDHTENPEVFPFWVLERTAR